MTSDSKGRVLIIDDEKLVGVMMVSHCRAAGYEAQATTDPEEFFSLAESWNPTFVVVDLVMGEVDGLAVLKQLAAMNSCAAVVIASGMGSKILDSAQQFAAASGLAYGGVLHKPFRRPDVAGVLEAGARLPEREEPAVDLVASWNARTFARELKNAASHEELSVVYQPQISCTDGRVIGYETLVRWNHPKVGMIPPTAFIPRAESVGLVGVVTDFVTTAALAWFGRRRGHTNEYLSVNISASELTGTSLSERLLATCAASQVAPDRVVLEVTETSAVNDEAGSIEVLTRLRLDGFQLSIDDFGTGYSSMTQLSSMPFTQVKIDRSFVLNLGESATADVMVRSMLQLSQGLELETVAEGVETAAALDALTAMGCDFAQGYHIAYPMDEATLETWLTERASGERPAGRPQGR